MSNIKSFIRENLDFKSDDPFYVFNVEDVIQKHRKWCELLPRVVPYYAVKANRHPFLLEVMIALGLGFDCASQFEITEVLNRGAKPTDIIFANPIKTNTFLEFSKNNGIDLMTFDNEEELAKIESVFPEARLVLRIKVDDSHSTTKLNDKYGADLQNVENLLIKAKDMKLNVVGVAFHVGSGCVNCESYLEAIQNSRIAFDMASDMGFNMNLLDIGGGFPGTKNFYFEEIPETISSFEEMAQLINETLTQFYPEKHLTIMGEPGKFYCESAFTLITKIITKTTIDSNDEKTVMYYLNDGVYGSFLDAIIEKRVYTPVPFLNNSFQLSLRRECQSILWGPTCDSHDLIRSHIKMPEMNIGEWLLFEDMGAYSLPYTQFGFNGMPSPSVKVFVSEFAENILMKTEIWPKIKSYLADIKWKNIYQEHVWYQMG